MVQCHYGTILFFDLRRSGLKKLVLVVCALHLTQECCPRQCGTPGLGSSEDQTKDSGPVSTADGS